MKLRWVEELGKWNSGGGQLLDMLTLKDEHVLDVTDDAVVPYVDIFLAESTPTKHVL